MELLYTTQVDIGQPLYYLNGLNIHCCFINKIELIANILENGKNSHTIKYTCFEPNACIKTVYPSNINTVYFTSKTEILKKIVDQL